MPAAGGGAPGGGLRPDGDFGPAGADRLSVGGRASARGRSARPGGRRSILGGADPRRANYNRKVRLILLAVVAVALGFSAVLVARYSGLFAIHGITATPTTHVSSQTISSLAAVPEGSTLFSVDEAQIADSIKQNPWVQDVSVGRVFPDTLQIDVTERTEAAIVVLSNGTEAWLVSTDGHWLEAVAMQQDSTAATPLEQATAQAKSDGVALITQVPATVSPKAGAVSTDETILACLSYAAQLPPALSGQVASYKAPSLQGISAVLTSGVEVALGSPTGGDISWKGEVALKVLSEYAGAITYVNVRTPDSPTWRGLDAASVQAGGDDAASGQGSSAATGADGQAAGDQVQGTDEEGVATDAAGTDAAAAGGEDAGAEDAYDAEADAHRDGTGLTDGGDGYFYDVYGNGYAYDAASGDFVRAW